MWHAQWKASGEKRVRSVPELDALLDMLHGKSRERPILVDVTSDDGNTLTIGVGSELSVLSYVPANGDPPYLSSIGNPNDEGVVVFGYMGEWTEIPTRNLVPAMLAREVMRHFVRTGELSDAVRWEED